MVRPSNFVVSLNDVDRDDTRFVGGKAANLGEMIGAHFPVPPGFVVTANSYFEFLKQNNFNEKIKHLLNTINYDRNDSLNQVSGHIRKMIVQGVISDQLVDEIFEQYKKLGRNSLVAIRSSATAEDSKEASFAGQNETFLNIRGEAVITEKLREAWASLFSPRSIFYRHEKKIDHLKTGIALVIQKMVESDISGVIFTVDPVTGDKDKIIIEAIFGLGEYIVQGKVTPDHYEVDKKTLQIARKVRNSQGVMLKKVGGNDREVSVPLLRRNLQKAKDYHIIALAKFGRQIEKHYFFPQDIEWAIEGGKIYIVQTRPVTTIGKRTQDSDSFRPNSKPILIGDPASPGIGVGHVRKVFKISDLSGVKSEDVLVAKTTNPDFVPAMRRAKAIITERGGRTSHAAIVAREFGIPAVVGAPDALKILSADEFVTVNGKTGEVFRGGYIGARAKASDSISIKTATKLYVNIADPELAQKVALKNIDGVGLLRAEFILAQIGVHPKKMLHDGKSREFVEKLSEGIGTICRAFYPRSVFYRTTDLKTNEYRNLVGGKLYEPEEANPMLGYRGAARYIRDPQVFKLELRAIKYVREKMELDNLNLMIPFVRTPREFSDVREIISSLGLRRSHTFKLYMMVEIPSNVILIEDFIEVGLDGVSIGSNDLTMLILGIDRDNEEIAPEFDERNKAVLWAIERVIKTCHKNKIQVSICGQGPSVYPGMIEKLVEMGIDSVSVSPDAIESSRRIIYLTEGRVINKK